MISVTPKVPYYAVIFTFIQNDKVDLEQYFEMSKKMRTLAEAQDGFLGFENAGSGFEISVSYWSSLEDIKKWKKNAAHLEAQVLGKEKWYQSYKVRISKVEKDYEFEQDK